MTKTEQHKLVSKDNLHNFYAMFVPGSCSSVWPPLTGFDTLLIPIIWVGMTMCISLLIWSQNNAVNLWVASTTTWVKSKRDDTLLSMLANDLGFPKARQQLLNNYLQNMATKAAKLYGSFDLISSQDAKKVLSDWWSGASRFPVGLVDFICHMANGQRVNIFGIFCSQRKWNHWQISPG